MVFIGFCTFAAIFKEFGTLLNAISVDYLYVFQGSANILATTIFRNDKIKFKHALIKE